VRLLSQFSLENRRTPTIRRGVRTVGVLLFLDALFMYDDFSFFGVDFYKCLALRATDLCLSVHIDQPPVALWATDLFVYKHSITPFLWQEQHSTDSHSEVSGEPS